MYIAFQIFVYNQTFLVEAIYVWVNDMFALFIHNYIVG
jgi:hypothetical protein